MNNMRSSRHSNSWWRMVWQTLVLGGFLLTALAVVAQHTAISALLPSGYHSEEALTWCGAASGQMVVAGYPTSPCTVAQADVAASIQAHKVESNWDTDPAGLLAAIRACPVSAGHSWVIFQQTDPAALMWSAAYWMTKNQYPIAVLLGTTAHNSYTPHQEHWVVITAIVTDLDPMTNKTVNLQFVQFVDPSPPNLGDPWLVRYVSGTAWLTGIPPDIPPVMTAVTKTPSTYKGRFVAIIEPPSSTGRAVAAGRLLLTGTIIPKAQAQRLALDSVKRLKLADIAAFREFAGAKPLEPLLVNAQRGGYYLIPFAVDQKLPTLAVIVNAYNGEFQEAGHFAPRSFLAKSAALEHARVALRLQQPLPGDVKAELVSPPDTGTLYAPEWRIVTGNRTLQVGQRGTVREVPLQAQPQ